MVAYGTGESTVVVRLQCVSGCGIGTIKVWWKYVESKAYVRLKYDKSTVNTVKYSTVRKLIFCAYGICNFLACCRNVILMNV